MDTEEHVAKNILPESGLVRLSQILGIRKKASHRLFLSAKVHGGLE